MKKPQPVKDDRYTGGAKKIEAFLRAHPELKKELDLWIVARATCEAAYPDAAAIIKRELGKL